MKPIVAIVGSDDELPCVVVDSDNAGNEMARSLRANLYALHKERVVQIGDVIKLPAAELEDLVPRPSLIRILERYLKGPEDQPLGGHADEC